MKRFLIITLFLIPLLSCSLEQPEYPKDISKSYNSADLKLPCKMVVINNNISYLSEPYLGSKRLGQYKAGELVRATEKQGDWFKVKTLLFPDGWVHKDNLQPST